MKKVVVLIAVTIGLLSSLDAGNRHRWRGGRGTVVIHRGGGNSTGAFVGGAALGLGTAALVSATASNNNANARRDAELEQLRRERENDRYNELRREHDREQLRREFEDNREKKRKRESDDESEEQTPKRRQRSADTKIKLLQRRLEKLYANQGQLEERLEGLQVELEDAPKDKNLKRQIKKASRLLEKVQQKIDALEERLAELE